MDLSSQLKAIATQGAKDAGADITPKMDALLAEANLKHSRNGDPLGHTVEALAIKLSFALQDPTVLAEITDAELHMLDVEVLNAKEAKATKGDILDVHF